MNKYTIYCTEEQTKKAFELGAPIQTFGYPDLGEIKEKVLKLNRQAELYTTDDGGLMVGQIPTAEQMIGWLEERGIWIHFCKSNQRPELLSYSISKLNKPLKRVFIGGEFPSRKAATLAAVDAALDYLIKNITITQ